MKKIVVSVLGGIFILIGLILLIIPGPGVLMLLLGLGILGSEFPWAKRMMRKLADKADQAVRDFRARKYSR